MDKVYVIKSNSMELSRIKLLDYVMDFDDNIICWDRIENAKDYLISAGLEDRYAVFSTSTVEIEKELETKGLAQKNYGVRVIQAVRF